jgi:hypothetical protein
LTVSYFTPAAVVTIPATVGTVGAGAIVGGIGLATDSDDAKQVGGFFLQMGLDAASDGITAGGIKAAKGAKDIARVYSTYSKASDMARGVHGDF